MPIEDSTPINISDLSPYKGRALDPERTVRVHRNLNRRIDG